jgi:hypothetical protein
VRAARLDIVERLMAEHGDAKLTDLLVTLADCAKARSVGVHDRRRESVRVAPLRQRLNVDLAGAMPRRATVVSS